MKHHLPIGTFINMATVSVGSLIGIMAATAFPANVHAVSSSNTIGLGTLSSAFQMALKVPDGYLLIFIFSLILGGVIGELIHLDDPAQRVRRTGSNRRFQVEDSRSPKGWSPLSSFSVSAL